MINGKKKKICSYLPNYNKYLNKDKLEIKLINIKNISDISYMFSGCLSLVSLPDISKINLNSLTNIKGIFFIVHHYHISKWDTKNIQDICGIFQECSSLSELPDISKWNTENVTTMNGLFSTCSSLISLPDISKWNKKNVSNMDFIFDECSLLSKLPDIS